MIQPRNFSNNPLLMCKETGERRNLVELYDRCEVQVTPAAGPGDFEERLTFSLASRDLKNSFFFSYFFVFETEIKGKCGGSLFCEGKERAGGYIAT